MIILSDANTNTSLALAYVKSLPRPLYHLGPDYKKYIDPETVA